MVIYEVTADVAPEQVEGYERYMREKHIPDVLGTGCFEGASFLRGESTRYRIAYWVRDEATLNRYLQEHAPALRADFAQHFPGGVQLSREVWHTVQQWHS